MSYKLLGLFLVLLVSTPLYGQEASPLIVDTLQPTPTTVKTGELFVQLYRVRFLDLSDEGLELLINEDNLRLSNLGEFEVVDFCIDKGDSDSPCVGLGGGSVRKEFLEQVWYLQYTLRIVSPKKGTYKIPPVMVYWTLKEVGETSAQAESKKFESQGEVYINYVTTLTEDPNLTYRDGINFGSFSQRAFSYRIAFWSFLVFPPLLWLIWLIIYLRLPVAEVKASSSGALTDESVLVNDGSYQMPTKRQAFSAIRKNINNFAIVALSKKNFNALEMRERLTESIMDLLRNWVPESRVGTTPVQMEELVNRIMIGTSNGGALQALARRAAQYQRELEIGSNNWSMNPAEDAVFLRNNLNQLRWYARFYNLLYFQYLNILGRFRFWR